MTTRTPCIGGPLDGNSFTPGGDRRDAPLGYSREAFQEMRFFVADTMGFLAARREMRRLYAKHWRGASYALESSTESILKRAQALAEEAVESGVVLTITQRPLQPLGMAHYETVVEVRPVQVPT